MKKYFKISSLLLTAALTTVLMSGCSSDQEPVFSQAVTGGTGTTTSTTTGTTTGTSTGSTTGSTTTGTTGGTTGTTGTTGAETVPNYIQEEQLARPAIAEGLLYTNSNFAIYNSVSPSQVLTALTQPNSGLGMAAAPVFKEAEGTLALFVSLTKTPGTPTVNGLAGTFLPDVMRIDTTLAFVPVAGTEVQAYATFNSSKSTLVGGRKLTDDTIDDTLTVLTGGGVTTDNVPYYRPASGAGSQNFQIGHQNLNGQTTHYGPSVFPFLAPAN